MAKTYEAMMKAEEEAQKKQSIPSPSLSPSSSSVGGSLPSSHELNRDELPSADRGLSSGEYYRLRMNILRSSQNGKIKTLLFLSPTGGEGATTVLVEFAVALAGQGEKVLLIDANFRSPSLHQQFDLDRDGGLTDLFLRKIGLKDAIKPTSFRNLFVITAGRVNGSGFFHVREPSSDSSLNSHELNCEELLARMKSEADWVLFDGPPVNRFDEGLALSGKVDGVVMVLQAEKTRWEVAQAAKQRLEDSGGKILGVVLNKRRFYIPKWIYKTL